MDPRLAAINEGNDLLRQILEELRTHNRRGEKIVQIVTAQEVPQGDIKTFMQDIEGRVRTIEQVIESQMRDRARHF